MRAGPTSFWSYTTTAGAPAVTAMRLFLTPLSMWYFTAAAPAPEGGMRLFMTPLSAFYFTGDAEAVEPPAAVARRLRTLTGLSPFLRQVRG